MKKSTEGGAIPPSPEGGGLLASNLMIIVTYNSQGQVTGVLNIAPTDLPAYQNYIPIAKAAEAEQAQSGDWRVNITSLALELKTPVSIVASKTQLTADGIDETTVTFNGLAGSATAIVGGAARVNISPMDNQIVITSNAIKIFPISLADDAYHRLLKGIVIEAK